MKIRSIGIMTMTEERSTLALYRCILSAIAHRDGGEFEIMVDPPRGNKKHRTCIDISSRNGHFYATVKTTEDEITL